MHVSVKMGEGGGGECMRGVCMIVCIPIQYQRDCYTSVHGANPLLRYLRGITTILQLSPLLTVCPITLHPDWSIVIGMLRPWLLWHWLTLTLTAAGDGIDFNSFPFSGTSRDPRYGGESFFNFVKLSFGRFGFGTLT